jgi:hypothetical protein
MGELSDFQLDPPSPHLVHFPVLNIHVPASYIQRGIAT